MTTAHPPTLFYLPISLQCLCAVQEVVCTYYYYLPPNTLPLLPFIYATLSFLWAPKAPGVLGLGVEEAVMFEEKVGRRLVWSRGHAS